MSKRRVLITADPIGGVWTYARNLIRAVPEFEWALCSMGAPLSPAQRLEFERLPDVRVFENVARLEWMDDPWSEVDAAGEWLLQIAQQFEPEIIHLNGYAHAALPWNAPVLVVAHSCVLSWWRAVKGEAAPARYAEYARRVSSGLNHADAVVAPSEAMLRMLHENYGAHFAGRVIYNGVPLPPAPQEKRAQIFAAGRFWDEAKNLRVLEAVAASVRWPVRIAGDLAAPGGETITLRNAKALGRVPAEELERELTAAEIFVSPARYEPFGLSIAEAAAHGCTLVLGDIPTLRELWRDSALFVRPDDPHMLAHVLNCLIQDRTMRLEFAGRARRRVAQFSLPAMAEGYRAMYADLRERRRIGAAA